MEIEVDLTGVKSKKDIILRFSDALQLHDLDHGKGNWDAFSDYFRTLNTDSRLIREIHPIPRNIHLIIKNIWDIAQFSKDDYSTLCEILVEATDPMNRGDRINLTFQVSNDPNHRPPASEIK